MADNVPSTLEKALALNLDPLKYGTIVEIGAGQEVARLFFRAGAAAGTIAKTMSAYDTTVSDEIYGAAPGRRYVSRHRLERMIEREFDLVVSRVKDNRPENSTFFAFADTVAAQAFRRREECHGWMGVRFQMAPDQAPDDIILHVRMLDDTNLEQQEALGIIGVNLIYGAYFLAETPELLVRSLMDNLKWGRAEIDLIEFRGPTLGAIDDRLMALELVKASLTRAVLFDPDDHVVIPADALYKQSVVAMRGRFRPVNDLHVDIFDDARARFLAMPDVEHDRTVLMAEMTMAELANEGEIVTSDFLSRVGALTGLGFHVLISEFFRHFRFRQYLARYTRDPVAIAIDAKGFADVMNEDFYDGLSGGILEGVGNLFPPRTTMFVYPTLDGSDSVTLADLPLDRPTRLLVDYLTDKGRVVPVDDFQASRRGQRAADRMDSAAK